MKSRFGAVPGIVAAIFALMAPVFFPVRPAAAEYPRTEVSVEIPEVTLTRTDGIRVPLRKLLADGKPVMVQFIFTTCTTICPVMSAVFATVREELGPERKDLRMISFTIDPEHDTPAILGEYAKLFDADEEWIFLTGSHSDIVSVERAFGEYAGNKMNHAPLTFLRPSPGSRWVRIEEIVSAEELGREAREMLRK
jgi:protein SCO1/2